MCSLSVEDTRTYVAPPSSCYARSELAQQMRDAYQERFCAEGVVGEPKTWAARASPCSKQTDNTPRVRFSATLGEEPEVEVALV